MSIPVRTPPITAEMIDTMPIWEVENLVDEIDSRWYHQACEDELQDEDLRRGLKERLGLLT
jgi:hypothetical protein